MKNKSRKSPRTSTLVDCELVPVTDPVELVELDRRCREALKAMAAAERALSRRRKPAKRK